MEFNKYEKQKTRVKNVIDIYARMKLKNEINYITLKNIYNPTIKDAYAEYNIKKITRNNQDLITEKLIELTEQYGITAQQSLEARKQVLSMAIDKGDLSNANKALDSFDSKLDLTPIKTQTTQSIELKGDLSHLLPSSKDVKQLNDELKQLDVEDKDVKQ